MYNFLLEKYKGRTIYTLCPEGLKTIYIIILYKYGKKIEYYDSYKHLRTKEFNDILKQKIIEELDENCDFLIRNIESYNINNLYITIDVYYTNYFTTYDENGNDLSEGYDIKYNNNNNDHYFYSIDLENLFSLDEIKYYRKYYYIKFPDYLYNLIINTSSLYRKNKLLCSFIKLEINNI